MESASGNLERPSVSALLRGEAALLRAWLERGDARRLVLCLGVIAVGAGLYGAAMGWWRAPQQALYTAIKLPLILLLTATGNALLNAMLAPLLGLSLSLRQSFFAILMSLTIAAAVLGSFSPLAAFVVWNTPPLSAGERISNSTYNLMLLTHVVVVAFAGIVANLRLVKLLRELSGSRAVAARVLLGWLAGNLFLGSQLSWILRPFVGSPVLPVAFLRETAFKGNFYETVFGLLQHSLNL
jgi:hypothetical protein